MSESIATVVNVRWTTDEPTVGRVRYGTSGELPLETPPETEPTRDHSVYLLGLTSDTEYRYRAVTGREGNGTASEVGSITTGALPAELPTLSRRGTGLDQLIVVPVLGSTTAVLVIDPAGEIVWYHTDDRSFDFYRARLSRDGASLLYNAASVSGDPAEDSELVRVALDGTSQTSIPVPLLAHDFVELPDGTLAAIVVDYRDVAGTRVRGDSIVEVDPTGTQRTVWSAWDCFDPSMAAGDSTDQGWTFANALDYDTRDDAYYLGLRNLGSITKIDRTTGTCEWVLGGNASTFDFASGSSRFLHQHQFDVFGDHVLVMDNDGSLADESRVLEYVLDLDAHLATEIWSYVAEPPVYTFVLGEPSRLENGDTFVNWSTAGQMELVDPSGTPHWQLNTNVGFAFGFHTLADTLYPTNGQR